MSAEYAGSVFMLYSGLPASRKTMLNSSTRSSTCGTTAGLGAWDWHGTDVGCTSEQRQTRKTGRLRRLIVLRMSKPLREGTILAVIGRNGRFASHVGTTFFKSRLCSASHCGDLKCECGAEPKAQTGCFSGKGSRSMRHDFDFE